MKCERCGKEMMSFRCSWFNQEDICSKCQKKEEAHPLFQEAKRREHREVVKGNLNYEGVGLPDDLK